MVGLTMFYMATVNHKRWDPCLLYRTSLNYRVPISHNIKEGGRYFLTVLYIQLHIRYTYAVGIRVHLFMIDGKITLCTFHMVQSAYIY